LKQDFRKFVEEKLPRDEEKELFRDLLEAYDRGEADEVKTAIQELIRGISGA